MVKYSITSIVLIFGLFNLARCEYQEPIREEISLRGDIKILAIGNSYSQDAMLYVYDMLQQLDVDNRVVLVNAYIAGGSLQQHAQNIRTGDYSDLQRQIFHAGGNTENQPFGRYTLLQLIQQEKWDIITLQQASRVSGNLDSYDADLDFLIDYIEKHATNPRVKIGWHMTWAWAQNYWSNNPSFSDYQKNQLNMYSAICNAVQKKIVPNPAFDFIIPAGTAIQNARGYFGDVLNRDGTHLDNLGCYIAAAIWVKTITGYNIENLTTPYRMSITWSPNGPTPYTVGKNDFAKIVEAVNDAADFPFTIK